MALLKRVRIFAWVHVVFGALGLLPTVLLFLVALADQDEAHLNVIAFFLYPLAGMSLVYFIPSLAGGLGLLRGVYWARGLLWIEAGFLALLAPVGTVLAGFTVWALLPRKGEAVHGPAGMAAFEQFLVRFRPAALAAIAALGALGAMIGLGYVFREQIEALDPQPKQELTPLPDFNFPEPVRPQYEPRPPPTRAPSPEPER